MRLDQDIEDGYDKRDSMQGTLDQGTLSMISTIGNIEVTFVLKHELLTQACTSR